MSEEKNNGIRERHQWLCAALETHNYRYYIQAAPTISDQEYDRLMQELLDIEAAHPELVTPDSPSQRVGGAPADGFVSVYHQVPMLSIDNTYNEAELRAFDTRVRRGLISMGGGTKKNDLFRVCNANNAFNNFLKTPVGCKVYFCSICIHSVILH